MKIFKFGGASVRNADAIRNMTEIVRNYSDEPLIIVVSAIGKTTNQLEQVVRSVNREEAIQLAETIRKDHETIARELFSEIIPHIQQLFDRIFQDLHDQLGRDYSFDQKYDQIVSLGESLSSQLIAEYMSLCNLSIQWIDSCYFIRTNNHYREGEVDWEESSRRMNEIIPDIMNDQIIITQGFVGGTDHAMKTTLGREGSDFSAAVYAACLGASSVTVWKDVDGIMNGDPKRLNGTVRFKEIPYKEAAEMTYYGATVIHPKTIKPLANHNIPLFVKSFFHPDAPGTIIHDCNPETIIPAIIIKDEQALVSFNVRDFSFINEKNLSLIFHELAEADLKINLMQNSAISFSICVDFDREKLDTVIQKLKNQFSIRFNTGLQLITVKNYTLAELETYRGNRNLLLEQISRNNYRALVATFA